MLLFTFFSEGATYNDCKWLKDKLKSISSHEFRSSMDPEINAKFIHDEVVQIPIKNAGLNEKLYLTKIEKQRILQWV